MFTQTGLYLLVLTIVYFKLFNPVFALPTDAKEQDEERSFATMLGQFANNPGYFLVNRPDNNDNIDKEMYLHKKREMKRKWSKFFQGSQGSQSPYAIAFPALIRTR
ncbi:unnamed protein product [Adineta steineri]|uniref:Uncharacterized protein n=1 Tax=Adineta steineri TaxID=433720 RepID=A0A813T4R0_9BILA|nr:unnamed protein product [Adineta steineri]CAF0803395.1 unnamed protein product [Adineta steineri]CAF1562548.1 unnamed protein product [Adineta steineri]CAF3524335.1 unnamed protein product [Adineta steineri]CAF3809418.1 unnamed protein product [Adineta steineri]